MDLVLHRAGVTATFTLDTYPVTARASLVVPAINLPAGRTFRVITTLSATPADVMPPPIVSQVDGAAYPGSTQTLRMHLPLAGAGQVNFLVAVYEQVAGVWSLYDSTLASGGSVPVPQAPAVLAARPHWGANCHVFIPQTRVAGSLTPMLNKTLGSQVKVFRASAPWSYVAPASAAWDAGAQAQMDAFANWLRTNGGTWMVALAALPAAWGTVGGVAVGPPPANWATFDTFLDAFLARYGDIISVVENVNEPNGSAGFVGNNGWTWANFLTSQQHLFNRVAAYNAANGRTIKVAGPALAFGDSTYLQTMYDNGFGPYMDLVNIHPYSTRFDRVGTGGAGGNSNGVDTDPLIGWGDEAGREYDLLHGVQACAEVMAANGDAAKQIVVGECGHSTSFTGLGKRQSTFDVSLAQQADRVTTLARQAARDARIWGLVIYMLYDNNANAAGMLAQDITVWQQNYGLTGPGGQVDKPSLAAYLATTANPT